MNDLGAIATPGRAGSVSVSFVKPHAATALPPTYSKSEPETVAFRLYPESITPLPSIRAKGPPAKAASRPPRKNSPARVGRR